MSVKIISCIYGTRGGKKQGDVESGMTNEGHEAAEMGEVLHDRCDHETRKAACLEVIGWPHGNLEVGYQEGMTRMQTWLSYFSHPQEIA